MGPTIPLDQLHAKLDRAGIPIDGVSLAMDGTISVQFRPEATDAQRAAAAALAAKFDARPRAPRPRADLAADLAALSDADLRAATIGVLAHILAEHPAFATSLGIPVPGDRAAAQG